MRTPAEFSLALNQASEDFVSVASKHGDNDLSKISDVLISMLMGLVKYDGTNNVHNF